MTSFEQKMLPVEAGTGGTHRMSFFDADSSKRSREPPPTRRAVRRPHSRTWAEMTDSYGNPNSLKLVMIMHDGHACLSNINIIITML